MELSLGLLDIIVKINPLAKRINMVTCEYHGRTGNNIFQYVFARLLAEKNGLEMCTPWCASDFIQMTRPKLGSKHDSPVVEVNDLYYDQHGVDWFSKAYQGKRVKCSGFFQHPMYYDGSRNVIREYFQLPPVSKRPNEHVVMHVRLTDYADPGLRSVINPNWYGKILYSLHFNRQRMKHYIVTDEPGSNYHRAFFPFQPKIVSRSPKEDFNFIREFNTILCGNSSFSWWASWLSDAQRIFTFEKWMREPHGQKIMLAHTNRAKAVQGDWLH